MRSPEPSLQRTLHHLHKPAPSLGLGIMKHLPVPFHPGQVTVSMCAYSEDIFRRFYAKMLHAEKKWEGTGEGTRKYSTEELEPSLTVFVTVRDVVPGTAPAPYLSRAAGHATHHSVLPIVDLLSSAKQIDPALTELSSYSGARGQVINISIWCCIP